MKKNSVLFILSLFLLPVLSSQALAECKESGSGEVILGNLTARAVSQLVYQYERSNRAIPAGNLLSPDGGGEYECETFGGPYSWCTCTGGDGSVDCDNLFVDCDAIGGLYSCDKDFGVDSGKCHCEIFE